MNFKEKRSLYIQIVDSICDNLLRRKIKPNERIISIRDMAIKLGVNPNTVQRSYNVLQEANIIESKRGMGYFITMDGLTNAKEYLYSRFLKNELPELFNMMNTLEIDPEEIKELYINFKKENNYNDSNIDLSL